MKKYKELPSITVTLIFNEMLFFKTRIALNPFHGKDHCSRKTMFVCENDKGQLDEGNYFSIHGNVSFDPDGVTAYASEKENEFIINDYKKRNKGAAETYIPDEVRRAGEIYMESIADQVAPPQPYNTTEFKVYQKLESLMQRRYNRFSKLCRFHMLKPSEVITILNK